MPDGENPDVTSAESFRLWLVGEVREIRTRLDALPCEARGRELRALGETNAEAAGQRRLLLKVLPWVLAALGIGAGTGIIGKQALDGQGDSQAAPTTRSPR